MFWKKLELENYWFSAGLHAAPQKQPHQEGGRRRIQNRRRGWEGGILNI